MRAWSPGVRARIFILKPRPSTTKIFPRNSACACVIHLGFTALRKGGSIDPGARWRDCHGIKLARKEVGVDDDCPEWTHLNSINRRLPIEPSSQRQLGDNHSSGGGGGRGQGVQLRVWRLCERAIVVLRSRVDCSNLITINS